MGGRLEIVVSCMSGEVVHLCFRQTEESGGAMVAPGQGDLAFCSSVFRGLPGASSG